MHITSFNLGEALCLLMGSDGVLIFAVTKCQSALWLLARAVISWFDFDGVRHRQILILRQPVISCTRTRRARRFVGHSTICSSSCCRSWLNFCVQYRDGASGPLCSCVCSSLRVELFAFHSLLIYCTRYDTAMVLITLTRSA